MDGTIVTEQTKMALSEVTKESKESNGNKKEITTGEAVFSVLCFVLAFCLIHFAAGYAGGLWGGIIWLTAGVFGAVYARMKKLAVKKLHCVVFGIAEVFCLVPLFCTNEFVNTLAAVFTFLLLGYVGISLSGAELFGEHFVADLLEAICIRPFTKYAEGPRVAAKLVKNPKCGKTVLYVVLGLICSVPLSAVVLLLLIGSDTMFADRMESLFDMIPAFELSYIGELILTVPVWLYLFGGFAAMETPWKKPCMDLKKGRVLPAVLGYATVTPICLFYVLYIGVQFNYFTAAFGGTLPEEYSYSSYARQGFFELCAVAVINLGVIAMMNLLLKRKEDGTASVAMKVYCTLLSGGTVLLIVSALSKMVLYIKEMGMTPLRMYTSWFMLVMMMIFILVIVAQFAKLRFWCSVFVGFTVLFAILCFSNVDGIIAKYNVKAYQTGKLESVDFGVLRELGDAALTSVESLTDAKEVRVATEARVCYERMQVDSNQKNSVAYFSIPRVIGRMKR